MSKAIEFIESLGCSPALSGPSREAYASAVAALRLDGQKQLALLSRDTRMLSALLGGREKMAMSVATPDGGDEPQQLPGREDDDQPETEERSPQPGKPN